MTLEELKKNIEECRVKVEKCYKQCIERSKINDPNYWLHKADAYLFVLTLMDDIYVEESNHNKD